jgi:S-phase kinase-associated protein 1
LSDPDFNIEAPIPVGYDSKVLEKVVEFCVYHWEHPLPKQSPTEKYTDIVPWDVEFCKVDQRTLFDIILAANILDIPELLSVTCRHVAIMIKSKTPDEIRKSFRLDDAEELKKKESEWCCSDE